MNAHRTAILVIGKCLVPTVDTPAPAGALDQPMNFKHLSRLFGWFLVAYPVLSTVSSSLRHLLALSWATDEEVSTCFSYA